MRQRNISGYAYLRDEEERDDQTQSAKASVDECSLATQIAGIEIVDVRQGDGEDASHQAAKRPADTLRLGTQRQRGDFGAEGDESRPAAHARDDNDEHERCGGVPGVNCQLESAQLSHREESYQIVASLSKQFATPMPIQTSPVTPKPTRISGLRPNLLKDQMLTPLPTMPRTIPNTSSKRLGLSGIPTVCMK